MSLKPGAVIYLSNAEAKLYFLMSRDDSEVTARELRKRWRASWWWPFQVSYGTVYVAMRKLCEMGLVLSRDDWDEDGRVRFWRRAP